MKLLRSTLAAVAVLFGAFTSSPLSVANADIAQTMANKAAEEVVATPMQEALKDLYQALIRERGGRAFRKMKYELANQLGSADARSLARFLMDKLRKEIFGGRVNSVMWEKFTMELYFKLLEWWSRTPENPIDAADLGAWQSLIDLHKDVLGPGMRGSKRIDEIAEVLLDPTLATIRKWVEEWKQSKEPSVAPDPSKKAEEKKEE